MREIDKLLIDSLSDIADHAAENGLCPMPFRAIQSLVLEVMAERDILAGYRTPKPVFAYPGYSGKCPSCGAVFLDGSAPYCGNCGQRIKFQK